MIVDASVVRKDGTSEAKTVEVFWANDGVSLGKFVDEWLVSFCS